MTGLAWMALAGLFFSAMSIMARLSADYASWSSVAAVRAWTGVLVAILVARVAGHTLRVHDHKAAWARTLFGCGGMACSFYTMACPSVALGDLAAIRATGPIMIAVLAWLVLKERLPRADLSAVPIAFLGILLLVQPSLESAGTAAALALLGTVFSAFAMLFLRRLGPRESPEAVATHFGVAAGTLMTVWAVVDGRVPEAAGLSFVMGTGLAGGIGQLCMTRAYALERAAMVSAMGYLSVVATHAGAFFILSEPLDAGRAVGAGLVMVGGWVLVVGRSIEGRGRGAAAQSDHGVAHSQT